MRFRVSIQARRPSPALVISIIALIVVVGGGTFAIARGGDKKQDKKISDREVNRLASGLSVAHATNADRVPGVTTSGTMFRLRQDDPPKVVLKQGPFTLTAVCATSAGNPQITINADSTEPGSLFGLGATPTAFGPGATPATHQVDQQTGATRATFSFVGELYAPSGAWADFKVIYGVNVFANGDCVAAGRDLR